MSIMGVEVEEVEGQTEEQCLFIPKMAVVGIGGGGGNAVSHMVKSNLTNVKTICINTDAQALKKSVADVKVQIGIKMSGGLGCGADPTKGKAAAEEDIEKIRNELIGNNIVFITAGEGGGTGTGGAPVVAQVAQELNILTVAIVTKPFKYEGSQRANHAEQGIKDLAAVADTIIVIPNDKLLEVLGKKVTVLNAFAEANDVLLKAVRGISGSLLNDGLINLDFNDLRRCMEKGGNAIIGIGIGKGEDRAQVAVQQAIVCPLLDDVELSGARSIFLNIEAPSDFSMEELQLINQTITNYADPTAEIITGLSIDSESESTEGEIRVTVIATGLGKVAVSSNADTVTLAAPTKPIDIDLSSVISIADNSDLYRNDSENDNLDIPTLLRKQAD